MNIESLVFLCIFLSANAYFAYKVLILFRLAKSSTGTAWSGNRLDHIPTRIQVFFTNVLGQKAVLQKKGAGLMHVAIFWGFLIITVGTIELFLYEIFPPFSFEFLGSDFYSVFVVLQDSFTVLVLLGLSYAFYRRHIIRPAGLGKSYDADIIIVAITGLMVTLLGMNAFRMIADPKWFDSLMWASSFFKKGLESLVVSPEIGDSFFKVFRWAHLTIVLGFLVYIPSSKHLHILAAAPNTFLKHLPVSKPMRTINLENENNTNFGMGKISELSWKDALDLYACTECGRCQDACPAYNTQKPLSPKALVLDLKDLLMDNKKAVLLGKQDEIFSVIGKKITEDVIWACTSCRACEAACPVFIEQTDKIYESRRNLVLMEGKFPTELQTVFKNIENNFSPWAMSPEDRDKWAEGLEVKTVAQLAASGENYDYLFWVGCAGSYDDRNKKVSRALVYSLRKAGLKIAILGKEEKCTGDPARRMGNEYLAQTLIKENVNTLNNYKVTKVVTACPHCFNAIKNEWKHFGGDYEVIHHSQLLATLIEEGKLRLTKEQPEQSQEHPGGATKSKEKITYHDSCYIGRWNGEYAAPRKIINSIPGVEFAEMDQSGPSSMCCGAGGGRMWMEEKIGTRVNIKRTEQALEKNPSVIAANCPFCMTMLTDGIKAKELTGKVKVLDIAEMVASNMQ